MDILHVIHKEEPVNVEDVFVEPLPEEPPEPKYASIQSKYSWDYCLVFKQKALTDEERALFNKKQDERKQRAESAESITSEGESIRKLKKKVSLAAFLCFQPHCVGVLHLHFLFTSPLLSLIQALKDITMEDILERLLGAKFRVRMYYSIDEEEVYMKIYAPIELLQEQADRMQYKLELDEDELLKRLASGDEDRGIAPIEISDEKVSLLLPPLFTLVAAMN